MSNVSAGTSSITAHDDVIAGNVPAAAGAEATTTKPHHIAAIDSYGGHAEIDCVQFTSPNSDEMKTIDEAQARLRSHNHLIAKQSADVLDKELGLKSHSHDAIGLCPDGVENSIMAVSSATDSKTARYANAVKGKALAQKNVITFSYAPDALHEFLVPLTKAGLREVQEVLCKMGIVYHTLVSQPGGTHVVIVDQNRRQGSQIRAVASYFGAENVERWGKQNSTALKVPMDSQTPKPAIWPVGSSIMSSLNTNRNTPRRQSAANVSRNC